MMIVKVIALLCTMSPLGDVVCHTLEPRSPDGLSNTAIGYPAAFNGTLIYEVTDDFGKVTYTTQIPITGKSLYYSSVKEVMGFMRHE